MLVRDERLARSVTDGDQAAFAELYERYQQPLLGYCRSILGGEADSQDAVQSAFVNALAALQRDSRNAPVRPWLYRIAHNEAMSVLRRRGTRAKLHERLENQSPVTADWSADRERLELLVDDLWQLPERQRRALVMRELSGLSHQAIAARLGVSVSSAKQAIFEARRALTEFAQGRDAACEEIRAAIHGRDPRTLRSRRIQAHLRECAACAALTATNGRRGKRLGALVPAMFPLGLKRLCGRIVGASSSADAGGGPGIPQAAGALGGSAGATVAVKALTVAALVGATTAAGVAVSSPGNGHRSGTTALASTQGVSPAAFTTSLLTGAPFRDPGPAAGGSGAAAQDAARSPQSPGSLGSSGAQPVGVAPQTGPGTQPGGRGSFGPFPAGDAPGQAASPASHAQPGRVPFQEASPSASGTSTGSGSSTPVTSGNGNASPGTPRGNGPDGAGPPGGSRGNGQGQGLALGHTGGNGRGLALGHAGGQGSSNGNGKATGQGNGNGHGQGSGNGNGHATAPGQASPPGQATAPGQTTAPGKVTAPGQASSPGQATPPGQTTAPGQATPPGQATAPGQSLPPGQANGRGQGPANGNGKGNGNGRALGSSSSATGDPSGSPATDASS